MSSNSKKKIFQVNKISNNGKVLNNKRKRKSLLDDQAIEVDENDNPVSLSDDDFEKNEYDLNDSFIDDNEIDNFSVPDFYRNVDFGLQLPGFKKKKVSNSDFNILLKNKIINEFNFKVIVDKNLIYIPSFVYEKLGFKHLENQFKLLLDKVSDKCFLKDDLRLVHNYTLFYWESHILSFELCYLNSHIGIDFSLWKDMDLDNIWLEIQSFILMIFEKYSFKGDNFYYIYYNILGLNPYMKFIDDIVKEINDFFELDLDFNKLYINIIDNPGQLQINWVKIVLINYYDEVFSRYEKYKSLDPYYDINKENENYNKKLDLIEKKKDLQISNDVYFNKAKEQIHYMIGKISYNNDEENFSHFKEENYENELVDKKKFKCQSFGFVIYMDNIDYSDNDILNKNIHMPHLLPSLVKGVLFYLSRFIGNKILKKIYIAHEHGTKKFKCHCQGYLELANKISLIISPGSFILPYVDINDNFNEKKQKYLIMFQGARNKFALMNYVLKKDELVPINKFVCYDIEDKKYTVNDFFTNFIEEEPDNSRNNNSLMNQFLTTPNLDEKQLKELCLLSKNDKFIEYVISNYQKILKFNKAVCKPELDEFKWSFPQYVLDFLNNPIDPALEYRNFDLRMFYRNVKIWFDKYCFNNDPNVINPQTRKRGLFIYGKRGLGKSFFFQSFVGSVDEDISKNPFVVYCRSTLSWDAFEDKIDTAQLVILDDVDFGPKQKEIIKALIAGQSTYIKSNYVDNKLWSRSCPCVWLSNNIHTLFYVMNSDEFRDDLFILSIKDYIGPPGTEPNRDTIINLDVDTKEEIEDLKVKKEKKKEKQDFFYNIFK